MHARGIALVLSLTLIVWVSGVPLLFHAEAAQLIELSDTLSTSKPGLGSDHTIRFTTPSGIPADGSTMTITLPTGFDMSTIGEDDIDIADDGIELTTGSVCGAVQASVATSTQAISITICAGGGGAIAALSAVMVKIGTHATNSGVGAHRIINHVNSGSYELGIAGTITDQGYTRLVIVESVTVTGAVDTYLDFSIGGVDAGEGVNADVTLTTGTTTATTVPFGELQPLNEYVMAQDLFVTTNAVSGFTVTVEASGDLQSTSGATIDSYTDEPGRVRRWCGLHPRRL
ncbi:MAG: hypothetical protein HC828_14925 [Blastochloris sp.]|nr:hypothetical protein [Blastochloris sp.]